MQHHEKVFENQATALEAYTEQLTTIIKELALSATELDKPLINTKSEAAIITRVLRELRALGTDGTSIPFARSIDDPDNPPGNVQIMIWGESNIFTEISYPRYNLSNFGQLWNDALSKTQLFKPKNNGDK